jgi:hypothetical protein
MEIVHYCPLAGVAVLFKRVRTKIGDKLTLFFVSFEGA